MIRLIAVRGPLEMLALPGGAYGVRVGDLGKVFKDGRCAQDNWHEAYNYFHKLAKKQEKGPKQNYLQVK